MGKRVVVIDGSTAILDLMQYVLQDAGYETTLCSSSADALACVRESAPDVLILDVHVDRLFAGWDILEQIQADPVLQATPGIVCSADVASLLTHADALAHSGWKVLFKPFDIDVLTQMVDRLAQGGSVAP